MANQGNSATRRFLIPSQFCPPVLADKPSAPKPLPEDIVKAWKAAGAEVGWLRPMPSGFHSFVQEKEGKPGDVPAFHFAVWPQGRLAKLPVPAPAFGLVSQTTVTGAGLKELAALKSLQTLDLTQTQVTDAGLKELRKVLPGCLINR